MNNDKTPKVSVIVPNYNHAQYLPQRLKSIADQTFGDFEIILIDDCSTDNSIEVLREFAATEPRVSRVEVNASNSGSPFKQWLKGISMARGEYIWIAESDDSCLPELLETSVTLLDRHPQAVLSFVGATVYDEYNRERTNSYDKWSKRHLALKDGYAVYPSRDYLMHNMYWGCTIYNASGVVFRRNAFDASLLDDSLKMKNSGDYMFWTNLIACGDVIIVYRKLNMYREHLLNTTAKGRHNGTMWLEDIDIMNRIEQITDMGTSRRRLRHGVFYKQLMRSAMPVEVRDRALAKGNQLFGSLKDDFKFYRRYKTAAAVLPWLINYKHEGL